jgi:hypothetical protein
MGMGQKNVGLDWAFRKVIGHKVIAKLPDACTGIYDDYPV